MPIISLNGLSDPFFFYFLYRTFVRCARALGGRVLSPPGRALSHCALALWELEAVGRAKELRLRELRSRTFVKRSWELCRTMLMGAGSQALVNTTGAGSYALYHARAKMSIGAAKNFFIFLYIYLCKLYHTFALLSIHFKIKKEERGYQVVSSFLQEICFTSG